MTSEQVWYRFEGKREDGSVLKLRIQDFPAARLNDALDLITTFHARDEATYRASGIAHNPKAIDRYRKQKEQEINDPSSSVLICCSDDTPDVKHIMGLFVLLIPTLSIEDIASLLTRAAEGTEELEPETKKFYELWYECMAMFNPIKEFNLDVYYEGAGTIVDPDYRRLGIAENFFRASRIICEARGVHGIYGWMTAFGTQKAAAKAGWETVKEIEFDYLAKKCDVTFINVPRTMKIMKIEFSSTQYKEIERGE